MVEKGIEYPISEYQNGYSPVMQVPHQSNYDIIANVAVPSNNFEKSFILRMNIQHCTYLGKICSKSKLSDHIGKCWALVFISTLSTLPQIYS